jgi:hypothetical protein
LLKRITLTGCALGASLAAFAAPALAQTRPHSNTAATAAPTLYVSAPPAGNDQNTNGSATIQHAINEAPSAATIKVAAGTYGEQLTVDSKNLMITGTGTASNPTVISPDPATLTSTTNDPNHTNVAQFDIVTFENTSSGGLTNVTVNGQNGSATEGCTSNFVGVFFDNAGGAVKTSTIENVQHLPGTAGCQSGANGGVYIASNDGGSHILTMTTDKVMAYTKDGITCRDAGVTCNITGTTVTGNGPTDLTAQNGIEVFGIAAATINKSTVTGNTYTNPEFTSLGDTPTSASGILAIDDGAVSITNNKVSSNDESVAGVNDTGNAESWTITGNTVTNGTNVPATGALQVPTGDGQGDGIDLFGINGLTLTGNSVTANADWGIGLFGITNSTIGGMASGKPNTASRNGYDGIIVGEDTGPSTGDTFVKNSAATNARDGIEVLGADSGGVQQAASNEFRANVMTTNGSFDAEDNSVGGGTGGTGDNWNSNTCKPKLDSSPVALCSAK